MYERFFGFRERPFDLTPDPRYLVLTEPHREVLSNIEYGIASRKGLTLIVGDAGSGKTTVIRAAIERQPAAVHCVCLHNPALTRAEFVEMLGTQFELSARARRSKTALLLELEALLRRRRQAGETTVLIVDEAQSLTPTLLEEIRLLANIETNNEKLLSVILAGQPELARYMDDPSLSQLKQRLALRCELRPLEPQETAAYVISRIRSAGGIPGNAFTADAVTMIHTASKGVPRIINVLADNALLTGLATGTRPVNRQIVDSVCRDFRFSRQQDVTPGSAAEATDRSAAVRTLRALTLEIGNASTRRDASPPPENEAPFDTDRVATGKQPEPSIFASTSRRHFS